MAHFSAHVFDALEKRGYRVQSLAGAVTAFNSGIDVGRLRTGAQSCQARRASGGGVAGLFFQCKRRITHCWTETVWFIAREQRHKGAPLGVFSGPSWV